VRALFTMLVGAVAALIAERVEGSSPARRRPASGGSTARACV
jgi:hypothetical protein